MITDYDEFKRLLKESYPNTTEGVDGVLFLTMDSISLSIVPVPSDPGAVMFRLKVLELKDIDRPGKFAKAAVIDYLSKPENIEKIFNFIEKNAGYAFNKIMKIVEWVATHPEVALAVAEQAVAMFKGRPLIETETTRTVRFNYINGEMESVSISSDKNSSFGVNVDPLGVGLGVGE